MFLICFKRKGFAFIINGFFNALLPYCDFFIIAEGFMKTCKISMNYSFVLFLTAHLVIFGDDMLLRNCYLFYREGFSNNSKDVAYIGKQTWIIRTFRTIDFSEIFKFRHSELEKVPTISVMFRYNGHLTNYTLEFLDTLCIRD